MEPCKIFQIRSFLWSRNKSKHWWSSSEKFLEIGQFLSKLRAWHSVQSPSQSCSKERVQCMYEEQTFISISMRSHSRVWYLVSAHTDMSDMKYISSILLIFFINLNWSEGYSAERRQKRGLPIPPSVYQLFINDKAPDIDITPEQRGSCW